MVSDSPVLRAGIQALMCDHGVEMIGELDGPGDLLESVRNTDTRIVIAAPVTGGEALYDAIESLPGRCATLVLLAVASFRIQSMTLADRRDVRCLPLTLTRAQLCDAVDEALGGRAPLLTVAEVATGPRGQLSAREQQVLSELSLGRSNREIADKLWISDNTVKSHLQKIYRKLGVETRAEAVALYVGQLGGG